MRKEEWLKLWQSLDEFDRLLRGEHGEIAAEAMDLVTALRRKLVLLSGNGKVLQVEFGGAARRGGASR